jgi:hypothetical protein
LQIMAYTQFTMFYLVFKHKKDSDYPNYTR